MSAAVADLVLSQGETFDTNTKNWTWKEGGTPVNITGYSVELEIRRTGATSPSLAVWSTANGKLVVDGPAGKISPNVTAAETAALWEPGLVKDEAGHLLGSYSLEITSPAGRIQRLLVGRLLLTPKVYVP